MKILDKKEIIIIILFCLGIFIISFFLINKMSKQSIEESVNKQLTVINEQNNELAKIKVEEILKDKIKVFTNQVLHMSNIKNGVIDDNESIELFKCLKSQNDVSMVGVILNDKGIFINEDNQVVYFNREEIYDISSKKRNIFKYSINEKDYLVVKYTMTQEDGHIVTTLAMYSDGLKKNDLIIPVYSNEGYSYIIGKDGNSILLSTLNEATIDLRNIYEGILARSKDNLEAVNKLKLDVMNDKSGIIKYTKEGSQRIMSYSPIGTENLYICTIVPEEFVIRNLTNMQKINKMSVIIILIDLAALLGFIKLIDNIKGKRMDQKLSIDSVTNGNSYKKFKKQLKELYNKKELKAIYMAIDIDNFKIVNTVLGKEYGDKVLKKIYEILEFHIGHKGYCCRKNADLFLAYYEYNDSSEIEYIIHSICDAIRHIQLPNNHIIIPSIGICDINNDDQSIETIETNALVAKKKSKNKINEFYSYYEEFSFKEIVERKKILDEMNTALINKEFRVVYQPKFDPKTKKVVSAEALIRWTKSDNITMFPDQFIPIAEQTGFITFIDSYVFKEVCEKQVEWIKKGYNIVPISINISREKLKTTNFLYEYLQVIGECGLDKQYVQLEITEGNIYSYDNVKTTMIDLIKELGFTVLIDDFGVGYSSLTMMKDIHADYLKLDRSFVNDDSSTGREMVKYVIKMAKLFNYKLVAEGVETEEQFNFFKEDCDEIQGYYFSKPLEEEVFVDKYLKHL